MWVEDMIRDKSLGTNPFETFTRLARYYLGSGKDKRDVRRMMDEYLVRCDPTASLPKWSGMLDKALNYAQKRDAILIDKITVTKPEMQQISLIQGVQTRRLAFTLLCLAKYWMAVYHRYDGWVCNKDSEIMSLANINTSIKRQSAMYHVLNEMGLIEFSRSVDNTSVRVKFMADGETALEIHDLRNIGYQYLRYLGEPYFECQNCGIVTRESNPARDRRGRKQKYCKSCAMTVKMKQNVESVMRRNSGV